MIQATTKLIKYGDLKPGDRNVSGSEVILTERDGEDMLLWWELPSGQTVKKRKTAKNHLRIIRYPTTTF